MRQEMQALRRMMENELSELTWRDLGHRRPQTQDLIRRLMALGLDTGHCKELAYRVEDAETPEQAWRQSLTQLSVEIPILKKDLLDGGGTLALVGPTGVGKTTTIAKLAARFCLRHGNRHLALISADSYRIGAQEQLQNYGRILDVPVRSVTTPEELNNALHAFAEKRLVLIDTAGMGQRDLKLTERLALLSKGNHPVKSLLTLSATTQRSALTHAIRAFGIVRPTGVILTKMDEAASLGGVLSAVLDTKLPLAFVTDGQRVPEDIRSAQAERLIKQAVELSEIMGSSPDEEYLAMAFGGMKEYAHV
jgi:flagellar biosynthesis protein FlhF